MIDAVNVVDIIVYQYLIKPECVGHYQKRVETGYET